MRRGTVVTASLYRSCSLAAIDLRGPRNTATDNVVRGTGNNGIRITNNPVDCTIANNDVSGPTTPYSFTGTGHRIAGNTPYHAFATASRPAATLFAPGTEIFDTTLARPVWSNGTAWVNAAGAASMP